MGDMYGSVYKKNSRGYGGLSISMADRDFQEDEVWGGYEGHIEDYSPHKCETILAAEPQRAARVSSLSRMFGRDRNKSYQVKASRHSVPVDIPDWSKLSEHSAHQRTKKGADEENEDDDVMPPHEWLDRKYSRSQVSSFSVVEGAGRTLKGRDLSKVRDSVLTRTGFLE